MSHQSTIAVAGKLALGLTAMALLGCAANPAVGLQPSGEPLGLRITSEQFSYRQRQKIATVEYRTSTGKPAGRAEVYRQHVVQGVELFWRPLQGNQIIDDQDFFRIAGDCEAEEEIRRHRDRARAVNRIGFALLGAGVATMVMAGQADPDKSSSTIATVGGAGFLAAVTGALWIYYGVYHNRSENHVLGVERARQAADRYNRALDQR